MHNTCSIPKYASNVLMVRPRDFHVNPQTILDNHFQSIDHVQSREEIESRIQVEFNQLAQALIQAGIKVNIFEQSDGMDTPDAIFPNNWFSTHTNGTLVLYPMKAINRRLERRHEIIQWLQKEYSTLIELTQFEKHDKFLEGTGSLVLDRSREIAYAAISDRTHPRLVLDWCHHMNYEPVLFSARDKNRNPIYHTNVVLSLGNNFILAGLDTISDITERSLLEKSLNQESVIIIELSLEQIHQFAGNGLQLINHAGEPVFVLSSGAWKSLTSIQQELIESKTRVIHVDLSLTEQLGGGSARCMLAELF